MTNDTERAASDGACDGGHASTPRRVTSSNQPAVAEHAVSPDTHTGRHVPASGPHAIGAVGVPPFKLAPGGVKPARRAFSQEEFAAYLRACFARGMGWARIAKELGVRRDTVRQRARRLGISSPITRKSATKYDADTIRRIALIAARDGCLAAAAAEGISLGAVEHMLRRNKISIKRIRAMAAHRA